MGEKKLTCTYEPETPVATRGSDDLARTSFAPSYTELSDINQLTFIQRREGVRLLRLQGKHYLVTCGLHCSVTGKPLSAWSLLHGMWVPRVPSRAQ